MISERDWKSFRSDCIEAMERFQDNEIKLADIDDYLHKYEEGNVADEILQFILNTISEIDADNEGYRETLNLLKADVSETGLRQYMEQ